MHLVISYDVSSDNRRRRLAQRLQDHLQRVQFSVFEGIVPERKLVDLRDIVRKTIDLSNDSGRIYCLCARCRKSIEIIGAGPILEGGRTDVVL